MMKANQYVLYFSRKQKYNARKEDVKSVCIDFSQLLKLLVALWETGSIPSRILAASF